MYLRYLHIVSCVAAVLITGGFIGDRHHHAAWAASSGSGFNFDASTNDDGHYNVFEKFRHEEVTTIARMPDLANENGEYNTLVDSLQKVAVNTRRTSWSPSFSREFLDSEGLQFASSLSITNAFFADDAPDSLIIWLLRQQGLNDFGDSVAETNGLTALSESLMFGIIDSSTTAPLKPEQHIQSDDSIRRPITLAFAYHSSSCNPRCNLECRTYDFGRRVWDASIVAAEDAGKPGVAKCELNGETTAFVGLFNKLEGRAEGSIRAKMLLKKTIEDVQAETESVFTSAFLKDIADATKVHLTHLSVLRIREAIQGESVVVTLDIDNGGGMAWEALDQMNQQISREGSTLRNGAVSAAIIPEDGISWSVTCTNDNGRYTRDNTFCGKIQPSAGGGDDPNNNGANDGSYNFTLVGYKIPDWGPASFAGCIILLIAYCGCCRRSKEGKAYTNKSSKKDKKEGKKDDDVSSAVNISGLSSLHFGNAGGAAETSASAGSAVFFNPHNATSRLSLTPGMPASFVAGQTFRMLPPVVGGQQFAPVPAPLPLPPTQTPQSGSQV